MPIPRFFCEIPLTAHALIDLPDALAHHATRVLRLRDGAEINLFDGTAGQYSAVLRTDGPRARAQLGAHCPREAELAGCITLVQGLPTGDKMDWIIEKAVELGVHRIVPVNARRSVVHLSEQRLAKRMLRWQGIARSACEQCGRNRVPTIDAPRALAEWVPAAGPVLTLLCHPHAADDLEQALHARRQAGEVVLLIGPEGGWDENELAAAVAAGAQPVRFGSRVLRAETAGLALIAAVTALMRW